MKIFLIIFPLLVCPAWCFSQKEQIQELESALPQKEGLDFINDALQLAELYYLESMYDLASKRANEAFDKARSMGKNELMARALNWQGKAAMDTANGRRMAQLRAFKIFEQSNTYTTDNKLRLDNLQHMKTLAVFLNRPKDIRNVDYLISVIKGEDPPPLAINEGVGLFNKKKRQTLEEYRKIQSEKKDLTEELTDLTEEQAELREQQETLINLLETKEQAIVNMSEEQMKQELMLSEQGRLLDSMTFSSILDSLELSQQEMLLKQQESALQQQEAELELQKSQRNLLLAIAGLFVLLAAGLTHRFYTVKGHNAVLAEKNKIIQEERERSEELLLNILPGAIASELKRSGVAETQHYNNATVMFVDFIGFSKISKLLTPQQLVADLDHAFKNFDDIIEKYGLEKIKTIGDAYMCAGGVPNENKSHPVNSVRAAIEIQQFLKKWNEEKLQKNEPVFEARLGIHTGPLVAGVVGSKKFAYDIWGDTVNVASRMETSCEAGKVNISKATYERVKKIFSCEYRGIVPAKNVGDVEMYYVG